MKKKIKKAPVKAAKRKTIKAKPAQKNARKHVRAEKKKVAAFSDKEINDIREKLTEIRASLIKTIEDKQKYDLIENDIGDQIDEATQSLEKEVMFELSDNERQILDDVEAAIRKMENNQYGKCEHCGKAIDKKRLRAIPHSRYCISCQMSNEKYR